MIELIAAGFTYESDVEGRSETEGVTDLHLSIEEGECVVLCGRSGCGKSTILRMINGLAPQFYPGKLTGTVHVSGKPIASFLPEEKTRLTGSVFQDPRSQFFMSLVGDELAFSGENLGIESTEIRTLVQAAAARMKIPHLLDRPLDSLSSGQKQKAAIAAATILSPKLLILDEPSANLDEKATSDLVQILLQLKQSGTTLIISEHRLHAFLDVVDRYVLIEKGTIARIWTKDDFAALRYEDVKPYGLRHPDMTRVNIHENTNNDASRYVWEGKSLSYAYRKTCKPMKGLDITLRTGSVTALTGENGVGKTTLGKVLCGLMRQQRGEVYYGGKKRSAAGRRSLSYLVMQDADYQIYADSVGNEIVLGRRLNDELRLRAYEAMDTFDLRALRDRHPASLSGGEKQRVTMAAAYCSDAELIVLDEPTSGLDGDGVLKVAAWAKKLARAGKTVVIITHDRILTELACDHVVEMRNEQERVRTIGP
ncbi:ABC transporter ATP-binding protein [Paenibacillus profundus]|uniref:ABC transporter ATP-binding protein n=1 Tax=Paenibacillus profundus TaxID=1173085 RepID=A0ABS8YHP4_9BACL|nr:ABC transporter ATP-binding protein [Paenibacillus profundus]MCE5170744.1 ABC transporter ATP-binding protein [Paenibacillus profundus]